MTACVLLSGGIDSMVVLSMFRRDERNIISLFVDYGQAAVAEERAAAGRIAEYFKSDLVQLRLGLPQRFADGEIRHRNAALIFVAAMAVADRVDTIAVGIHSDVPYADCSAEFLKAVEATLIASDSSRTQFVAPLKTWLKREIIAYAKAQDLPIALTYSCEAGGLPPCGRCASCLDRVGL